MQHIYAKAVQHHQQGQYAQAEKLYLDVLARQPRQSEALNAIGLLYLQTGRFRQAREWLEKAVAANRNAPHVRLNLAEACRNLGNSGQAAKFCREALRLQPDNPEAHFYLGSALHDAGQLDQAVSSYGRALQLRQNFPEGHNSLGAALEEQGKRTQAIAHFNEALRLAPAYTAAHINLAKALRASDQPYEALEHYGKALDLGFSSSRVHLDMGDIWMDLQEYGKASPHFQEAIRLDPQNAKAFNGLGTCEMVVGGRDTARLHFERALELNPNVVTPLFNLAFNEKITSLDSPVLKKVQAQLNNDAIDAGRRATLQFALGKLYDDCREYDLAFQSFHAANAQVHKSTGYSIDQDAAKIRSIKAAFTQTLFRQFEGCGSSSEMPVFLFGMPRSGTTLTEQVISSHPGVHGAGELRLAYLVEKHLSDNAGLPYPGCLESLDPGVLAREAAWYLEGLRHFSGAGDYARITDKMPHNFMRLGLIALMFPKARFIHCRRDPMDNCLSLYFQRFAANRHAYAYDMTALGQYYGLYRDLMQHWREVLPISMLEVDYEAMIADPEATSRRLVDFVGLEWNDACLAPHKLERTVKTASQWQVRQPIYNTSVQRWRNYEKHLGPLMEVLGYQPAPGSESVDHRP